MERYFNQIHHEMGPDIDVPAKQQNHYKSQYTKILAVWNKLNERANKILALAYEATERDIDYDPSVLIEQIATLSGIESTISYYHAQAKSFLIVFNTIYIIPKRQELTEYDRATYLLCRTALQVSLEKDLLAVKENIRNRIISCQSMLKYLKDEK